MTEKEYREHPAISRSELWKFRESPQKFKYAKEHPPEPTPALLFGQVFHKLVLEPETFSEEFIAAPEIDRRTKDGKAAWQEFLQAAEGKSVIDAGTLQHAAEMVEALQAVPFAVRLLDGAHETPFFWQDSMTGEACKCRTDCLCTKFSRPVIVDLKTANDASTEAFTRDAVKYGYDLQAAMYSEGVEANIGAAPLFVFIVVEKAPPYAVNIFQADELFVLRGQMLYREYLSEYHYCKQTGNWYGYLGKDNQVNNLALPVWLAKELM